MKRTALLISLLVLTALIGLLWLLFVRGEDDKRREATKECNTLAKADSGKNGTYFDPATKTFVKKSGYEDAYNQCLRSKGLEP